MTAGREATAEQTCSRVRCDKPVGPKVVTLLGPEGDRRRTCGPYCEEDTEAVQRVLLPTYSFSGKPCYVVEDR